MNTYKKSPTVKVIKTKNNNFLGVGTDQYCVNNDEFEKSVKLLDFLNHEQDELNIKEFMEKNKISIDIFNKLLSKKLITSDKRVFVKKDSMEFKNNIYLNIVAGDYQKIIKNAKNSCFVIIGCGGIGNFLSYALNTLSPKKIILIDGDIVERGNLNRQFLFSEDDIGRYKVDVIKRELSKRNSDVEIIAINRYADEGLLSELKISKGVTLGILSGDSEKVVRDTAKMFSIKKIPFINVGYLNDISIIGPFYIPGKSCCPFCNNSFSTIRDEENSEFNRIASNINNSFSSPGFFTNTSIATGMAMVDIVYYLNKNYEKINSLNKRIGIDNISFQKYVVESQIDKSCVFCGKKG